MRSDMTPYLHMCHEGTKGDRSKMVGNVANSEDSSASSEEAVPPGRRLEEPESECAPDSHDDYSAREGSNIISFFSPAPIEGARNKRIIRTNGPVIRASQRSRAFMKRLFPDTSEHDWNDWQWQLKNRFTSMDSIEKVLRLSDDERAALNTAGSFPFSVTPYFASLLDPVDPLQPIRRAVVPVTAEFQTAPGEALDPLGEEHTTPVRGIVHRYPDRVLFLVSASCSTYCRYCTRSRMVGNTKDYAFTKEHWAKAIEYIRATPTVRDVLISGGDPLLLPDEQIEWLLNELRSIKHVEFLRIGTKVTTVMPQRITRGLTNMLKRFHPLWVSIHSTHPDEMTPETCEACERLADAGIPLGSQTVLLKGINDNVETIKKLYHELLKVRVRPYYLYQCDPIAGSSHFRCTVQKGLEIIQGLRGHTTGYAVPQFVIDAPGGGGKIPLLPEYVVGREDNELLIKNYEGKIYRHRDPI